MARLNILSGAKVLCYINGTLAGQVSDFTWNSDTPHARRGGLDTLVPVELVPEAVRTNGTMSLYRMAYDGGAEGLGMTTAQELHIREKYFSLTLIERTGGRVIFHANNCVVNSQSWEVRPRQFVMGRITFEGLTWANDTRLG